MNRLAFAAFLTTLVAVSSSLTAQAPAVDGNHFRWTWGSDADVAGANPAHITSPERVGPAAKDGDVACRALKANQYQIGFVMPAFDFDAANHGAINHSFYLTVRFKDTTKGPVLVHTGKGGVGFYGAGYVDSIGGTGDGQWKEETIVIPRSMMRTQDGKTFRFAVNGMKADVPIAWLELFSEDTKLAGAKEKIAAARKAHDDKIAALCAKLLPTFKNLGLPEPGPEVPLTDAEKQAGFRVFFPPVSRQLFGNSQPREGELTNSPHYFATPGQYVTIVTAVRATKDQPEVKLTLTDLTPIAEKEHSRPVPASMAAVRWAAYSPQRIGSSWGKDYRICPEQLVRKDSQAAKPDRLEIATITFQVPPQVLPYEFQGKLTVTAGAAKRDFTITVTVYPFTLDHPDHSTHGQFYYFDYGNYDPFELADMREHGMDTLVGGITPSIYPGPDGKYETAGVEASYKALKELGYRSPLITNAPNDSLLAKPESAKKYNDLIALTMQLAKKEGFDVGFFPIDEPHEQAKIDIAKKDCKAIHETAGAKTYITSNPGAVKQLGNLLDYVCYNLTYLNDESVAGVKKANQTLMFYCPSIDVNPEYNRYRAGFYFTKLGAYSCQFFTYMEGAGEWECDLDGPNRDWNCVFPSMTDVTHDPTLEWEAIREGVDDYRYAYTLRSLAEKAKAKGKTAEADKALKLLDELLSSVDIDGKKAGGPAIGIEADVRLKDKKLTPEELAAFKEQMSSAWYDQTRQKIAQAIIELKKAAQ